MNHRLKILAGLAVASALAAGSVHAQCTNGTCSRMSAYPAFYGWNGWTGYNYSARPKGESAARTEDAAADSEPEKETVAAVTLRPFSLRVIELVNRARAQAGLPELAADEKLCGGCDSHSALMRSHGFGHAYGGGLECIACGVSTPEAVVRLWLGSGGHRAILLGRGTRIGVGCSGSYWTLRVR